jgi:hypothetical protein
MTFYLRIHPFLFKDKADTEKQFKNYSDETSLEWRQYCLDSFFTNYNQVIQDMTSSIQNSINYLTSSSSNLPVLTQNKNQLNLISSYPSSSTNSSFNINNSNANLDSLMCFFSIWSNISSMNNNPVLITNSSTSASLNMSSSSITAVSTSSVDNSSRTSTVLLSPSYINSKY